ncbi:hypothetical protein YC2023_106492 [Brassica napus]
MHNKIDSLPVRSDRSADPHRVPTPRAKLFTRSKKASQQESLNSYDPNPKTHELDRMSLTWAINGSE